jgi:tRNA (Thr-GGU) A37 N-methylase
MDRVPEAARKAVALGPGWAPGMPAVGVFATRTQFRPNPLGVTVVELMKIDGNALTVVGLDALNGTPVLDIRPYLPPYDAYPDASLPPWVYGPNGKS